MKNLFFGILTALAFTFSASAKTEINHYPVNTFEKAIIGDPTYGMEKDFFRKAHLEGTIRLSGGCVIHYSIDVEYTIIPPAIQGVSGTLTMSGPCSGSQTFSARATTSESGTVETVTFNPSRGVLADPEFNRAFVNELNNANLFRE